MSPAVNPRIHSQLILTLTRVPRPFHRERIIFPQRVTGQLDSHMQKEES